MTPDDPQYPLYAPETELDQAIGRIAQAVFDYRAEFLFGAGMSVDCGVASGAQLAREMLKSFFRRRRRC